VLLAGAVVLVGLWPPGRVAPVSAGLVVLAVVGAPVMIGLHARWTREMLGPLEQSRWYTSGLGPAVAGAIGPARHLAALAGLSLVGVAIGLAQVAVAVVSLGRLLPWAVVAGRPVLRRYRNLARAWTGDEYADPYRAAPEPVGPDPDGRYRVGRSLVADRAAGAAAGLRGIATADPATWRDLVWLLGSAWLVGPGLVPLGLAVAGFVGLVWVPLWWVPFGVPTGLVTGRWSSPFPVWDALPFDAVPGLVSPLVGLAVAAVGLAVAGPLLRVRRWWDGLLLGPTPAARLAQRVRQLTASRADAVDTQASELRRIERDLHDGAQARLVHVGLSLATVEQLLDTDPEAAHALLAHARQSSATALEELRDLVRGIHPPVLAERGLADAVRAIALDSPLQVDVVVRLPGRLDAPVESAAYFAVCELLANAGRHGGAARVAIELAHDGAVLRIVVRDDGRGGADPARGTGLRGITRRLGTFDGALVLHSPPGGPTVVTMEIPCASSSPRTSTC
jgi:signal transduction histidine kinase